MSAAVADSEPSTPTGAYTAATGGGASQQPTPLLKKLRGSKLARKWFALRWQLARSVFARPLPFLTESLELKLGDLLVTLPVAAGLIIVAALGAKDQDVKSSGSIATIAMLIVFALTIRNNSILLTATGLPFERVLFYHKFFGGVAWLVTGLHGLAYLLEDSGSRRTRRLGRKENDGSGEDGGDDGEDSGLSRELTGALTFYFLSALVAFSFYKIRRRFFELFLRTHWILFILIIVFGVMHGAGLMLFGFIPWALDTVVRFFYWTPQLAKQKGVAHASQVTVALVAKDIVRVQFPRQRRDTGEDFHYEAGQYVFLCFPKIAKLEWHPFTIASAPHEPMVTIYIKVLGDWTKKLAASVASQPSSTRTTLIDGPYGAVSIEMDHYSHLVFVSGGIGVTPMLSIANDLFHASTVAKTRTKFVQKAWFLWSVRDREMIEAIMLTEAATRDKEEQLGKLPQSWLPQGLLATGASNSRDRDAFYAELFLTKGTQDLANSVDQKLALSLKYGQRPDIAKTLREVGEQAMKESSGKKIRIGVLVCGPQAMITGVVQQSMKLSGQLKGVTFDVHQETFDF